MSELSWLSDCCGARPHGELYAPTGSECAPDFVSAATREGQCGRCRDHATFSQDEDSVDKACARCGHMSHREDKCTTLERPVRVPQGRPPADDRGMLARTHWKSKWRLQGDSMSNPQK